MKEPEISPNFTTEDIHIIREYDAEKRRVIGEEAYWAEVREDALYMQKKIKEARERRFAQESVNVGKAI